ncbi:hypothetical protein TMEC54S_00261 [Thauera mechernichensis]
MKWLTNLRAEMDRRYRNPEEQRYICRLETSKSWRVQYVRGLEKPIQLYFSDRNYGSKEEALAAAKAFRDQVVAIHAPKAPKPQRRNLKYMNKDQTQVGITLRKDFRSGRSPAYAWSAEYMRGSKPVRRTWSIRRHGYEKAYQLASAWRHEMTGQRMGQCPPPSQDVVQWAKLVRCAL